jgi:hypothetical protein
LYQNRNRLFMDIAVLLTLLHVLNVKTCVWVSDRHAPQSSACAWATSHASQLSDRVVSSIHHSLLPVLLTTQHQSHNATSPPNTPTPATQNDLQSHPSNIFSALPHPHLLSNLHSRRLLRRLVRPLQSDLAHFRAARDRREQARQNHLLQSRRRCPEGDCWKLWRFCVRFSQLSRHVGLYLD